MATAGVTKALVDDAAGRAAGVNAARDADAAAVAPDPPAPCMATMPCVTKGLRADSSPAMPAIVAYCMRVCRVSSMPFWVP